MNHREVYGIDDAGTLLFGRVGRGVLSVAFCLCESEPTLDKALTPIPLFLMCIFDDSFWEGDGLAQIVHDKSATGEAGRARPNKPGR